MPVVLVQQPSDAVIEAVAAYAHLHTGWRLRAFSDASLPGQIRNQEEIAGVIAKTKSSTTISLLQASGLPWINITHQVIGVPSVVSDRRAVGRVAGRHFDQLGIRSIACLGADAHVLAEGIRNSSRFDRAIQAIPKSGIIKWLVDCDHMWGCLCSDDGLAVEVIHLAQSHGISVPNQLAVCGINNNLFQAHCAEVPLTSIDVNMSGMATAATRLLHAHLTNGRAIPPVTLVKPGQLCARRSTDVAYSGDPVIGQALRIMEAEFPEKISIEIIAHRCGCSRKSLERAFQLQLRQSPGAYLRQRRLRAARQQLESGGTNVTAIAEACGFARLSYFSQVFVQAFGCPPSQWRNRQDRTS